MTPGGLDHVRRDPYGCSRWLTESGVVGRASVKVVRHNVALTIFDVLFEPPPSRHLPGYPAEQARVTVQVDGRVFAVPVGVDDRTWLHRYQRYSTSELAALPASAIIPGEHLFGSLCLDYPDDPDYLRWNWSYGIDAYLRIVQRHLWSEEYYRRHGNWPVEDAPHGHRPDGRPHPITYNMLRVA